MPKPLNKEKITGRYFTWRLGRRNEIYYADGRSNPQNAGRHSLGTDDHSEALRLLERLDLSVAVQHGLADASALQAVADEPLVLLAGWELYLAHARRARVAGGARASSVKRYESVFPKFLAFAKERGIRHWHQVTPKTLGAYAKHLEASDYAYRTLYFELTLLKQVVKWLIEEGRLPATARIMLKLEKPTGTDTYCWRGEEVTAILEYCRSQPELAWLADVFHVLALTGMRASELRGLRRSDVDLDNRIIRLIDESMRRRKTGSEARTTKSGRDRTFPIHPDLIEVFRRQPRHVGGYVFHGPDGERLDTRKVHRLLIDNVLVPLAEQFPSADDEIGFKDGRLHSFRHFFCSLCANNNVPQQTVMLWLGHADSAMVRHYYHLHDAEARQHMSRLMLSPAAIPLDSIN